MKLLNTLLIASVTFTSFSVVAHQHDADGSGGEHADRFKKKQHSRHVKKHQRMLKKIDVNKDGQVDLNEYLAHAEQRFQSMDINGNGSVTPEELREWGKDMRIKHREAMKDARKAYRESKGSTEE